MELSILVAKIFGLSYVLLGLGMLLNGAYYKKAFEGFLKDAGLMLFGGMAALIIGFLLVNSHNIWVNDWTVIVTILGWLALLKGALIFLAPKFLLNLSAKILKHTTFMGVFVVLAGLIVGYFGFCS